MVAASVDSADGRRDVLVVATSAERLLAQDGLLAALRAQRDVVVHTSFVAQRPQFNRHGQTGPDQAGAYALAPWRTSSSWRRAATLAASPVPGRRRRARWAARLDPWFRQRVRAATDLVVLGPSGQEVLDAAREFGAAPQVHPGPEGLRALVHDLVARELDDALAAALEAPPMLALDLDLLRRTSDAARHALLLPAENRLRRREQLLRLPGRTRDPVQVRALASMARDLLQQEDPVLTAYLVRADLDEHATTHADPAQVAAQLLAATDRLVDEDLPQAVDLAALALEVLFHRELHSDSVEAPLVTDPASYLAPARTTRIWQLLTRPTRHTRPQKKVTPPAADPSVEPPARGRILLMPGAYGTFLQPVAAALRVSHAVDVAVLRRHELRPHLLTMGISTAVVHRRLAAALGQPFSGYPELVALFDEPAPDVVLLDWADKSAVLATLLAPPGVRIVLRVHGVDALRPWVHLLDWSRVEAVVCVSPALADLVRDVVGERAREVPVHVIPNLVDMAGLGAVTTTPREPRTLCMVGWAQRVKDPLWALDVLVDLRSDGTDWRLLMLGRDFPEQGTASGEAYARAFRERAMADDVRDHVEYTGFVDDLAPVLTRAGFVLSASLRESWHVGVAEAVSAGAVPVVRDWPMLASRGGARDLYGDAVVPDVTGAVERIRALADPVDRDRTAREAKEALLRSADPVEVTSQLRRLILGDLGRLADLSATGRHEEALRVVRAVLDDTDGAAPALLHQSAVSTALAGEPTLRLEVLRRWAAVDPSESVRQLVRQQEGRLRELTPGWLPAVAASPGARLGPRAVPGRDRVLHLLKASLPYRRSGYTLRSAYLLTEQARAGTDVLAVTALDFPPPDRARGDDGDAVPAEEQLRGVRHVRLRRDHAPVPEHGDEYLGAFATALAEVVRRERPTVIHAHSGHRGYDQALVALAVGRAMGVPVVYEVRGFFEALWTSDVARSEQAELFRLRRAVETACMRQAAAVTTLSESMREDIVERDGVDPERVFVIPNGVRPEELAPRPRRPELVEQLGLDGAFTFGYVSNLDHPREGQELLVEAVQRLRQNGLPATALVVGEGVRGAELRELARRRGVEEHVVFTGSVDHDLVGDYYALLDVFVVPRVDERAARLVTPLKPYEAMAMRLPVVVSDLPALLEIVGGGSRGESFPAGDADALAAVLARLAADPARRERLAEVGLRWVLEHRTWKAAASRYQQVYDGIAEVAETTPRG